MRHTFLIIILALSLQAATAQNILLKNGYVITISDGNKENTDILIENGKIKSLGKNLNAPSGMQTIDATGMYIMPGIIDAHSHIALEVVNEATKPNTAQVNVGDAINPYDIDLYHALAGGVTVSHLMHGSANAVGGQCETIKHRYGSHNPEDFRMANAPRTIKFALGENPIRVHGEGRKTLPATRMGVEQIFREGFSDAQVYQQSWSDFKAGKTKTPPQYSEQNEVMSDILNGKVLIHCHSYRADEILMLMNVLQDYGVNKICFQHVNEGFKVAPELKKFGASASVFSDWWAYKFEVYYSTAYNAAILTENGVVTSINSDSNELNRHLYHEAAKTKKYGNLTDEQALSLITINPAKQLGIEKNVGSIEIGKDGDIAIFNAHPLSIYAIPQYTIVDGKVLFDINSDPVDMRVDINPDDKFTEYYHEVEEDGCLQGVFESN